MKDSFLKTKKNITLEWENMSLVDKNSNHSVIDNLSGRVSSGQFLTIMGPSGAGKSSFLSLITAKLSAYSSNFKIQGKTTLNGHQYTEQQFTSIASYVPQDDLLLETLTVEQTLTFQARLKLSDLSEQQRQQRVQQILKMLNLYEIRNSYIGGRQKKSISGGQKKRVVIGVQLISNPLILVLDEPTSGLDSFNSLKIINLLSNLAKEDHILVVATIHQPSTLMFQSFDKLMVLKSGRQVYHDDSNKIVEYMESLNVKVDYRMNPADFFMLELSSYKQSQGYQTNFTAQNWQKHHQSSKGTKQTIMIDEMVKIDFNQHPPTPLIQQFKPLLVRNFKNNYRTPTNQFGRLMQMICYPLFLGNLITYEGVVFYDVIDEFNDSSVENFELTLGQFASFIFMSVFFALGQTIYDNLLVCKYFFKQVPSEKQLVLKEVHSNMYSLYLYYVTKLLIDIPCSLVSVYVATTVVYLIVGLENTFASWIYFAISGYLISIVSGIFLKEPNFAVQAAPLITIPLVVFGGLVVNLKTIPAYSSWFQYLTPIRYGYNLLVYDQLDTDQMQHIVQFQFVRDKLGLQGTTQENVTYLIILTCVLFVISFIALFIRKKFQ